LNASGQSFVTSALICALLAALFVARYCLAPMPVEMPFEGGMPLAATLTRFSAAHPWLATAAAVVVALWTLAVVTQLSIKYAPAGSRNYLPPQVFVLCAGGLVISDQPLAALTVAWLSTLAARQFARSFHKGYGFGEIFHAAFYMGITPLLYAPAALIAPVITLGALVIYRRSGREVIVALVGLMLPLAMAAFVYWAMGDGWGVVWEELTRHLFEQRNVWAGVPLPLLGVAVPLLALTLTGMFWALGHGRNIRRTQYKFMQHTSLVLFVVVASGVVAGSSTTLLALAATPCALSTLYAFSPKTAPASTLLYCLALIGACAINLFSILGISML
jgi:hypothetical protein